MEELVLNVELKERMVRALHSAVCFTLDKWTGQEEIDQEELLNLKIALKGCIFEFDSVKIVRCELVATATL